MPLASRSAGRANTSSPSTRASCRRQTPSITMYDKDGFQAPNPINRFAIGDRDKLKFNTDGSLDIYVQADSPGADKESNWLPAPKDAPFQPTMRLYSPRPEVLDGAWAPPRHPAGELTAGPLSAPSMEVGWIEQSVSANPMGMQCHVRILRDQGSLIAGVLALIAGILAYRAGRIQATETRQAAIMQVDAARRRDDREVDALRKSLGTELRQVVPRALGVYSSLSRLAKTTDEGLSLCVRGHYLWWRAGLD